MKKLFICFLAALAVVSACKKSSSSVNCSSDYSACYIDNYQYTYSGGNTDTTIVTYYTTDSFSYTTYSSGTAYIYCYKNKGDSISVRRYTNTVPNLSLYGTQQINGNGLITSEIFYRQNGSLNSTGTYAYNSDGTPSEQLISYVTYGYDYNFNYDANGNKTYAVMVGSGTAAGRDSIVYVYDLNRTNKIAYGYVNTKAYGTPDHNLLTQVRRYATPEDTLKSTIDYTYTTDACGIVTQRNTTYTYAGSGTVYHYIEKYNLRCQ